jgi:hypothetical protein
MTTAPAAPSKHAVTIPTFPDYAIEPDGSVWRITPTQRGPKANTLRPLTPVIHPKGHTWAVFLYDPSGIRKRVRINLLLELAFGQQTIS